MSIEQELKTAFNEAMVAAAEPLIQQALVDLERRMRARVREIAVDMVSGEIDIYRGDRRLIISIKDKGAP